MIWTFLCNEHEVIINRNDPTPDRGAQLPRASALIISSLGFIHDLRSGILEPDKARGQPLDMDQYLRLFGSARVPTQVTFIPYIFLLHTDRRS
jgi:Choline/Carnitine o-acyltransferase